ncbi:Berberine bridge enzyme-like 8 [Glycine max]|nr:Berberine bridge enzyme-like 8 [Glycine max]
MAAASESEPFQDNILHCLSLHSDPSLPIPISAVTYFPNSPSYPPTLDSYIRNLRFRFTSLNLCIEMSWIDSVLFWDNYPVGTSVDVLLQRHNTQEKYLKKKSDYVQQPISKTGLEGIWNKMMELEKPVLALNPYGGKMGEISEVETPFPPRAGVNGPGNANHAEARVWGKKYFKRNFDRLVEEHSIK